MSRRRYISTKLSLDAKVNKLAQQGGDFAALLYTWMIPHAEDDCRLTGDPDELLMTIIPGRRDKTAEDIRAALLIMNELDLIIWNEAEGYVEFPPEKFYAYQTYIAQDKRKTPPSNGFSGTTPQNAEKRRESPQIASSVSPSFSVSLSPSITPSETAPENPATGDDDASASDSSSASPLCLEVALNAGLKHYNTVALDRTLTKHAERVPGIDWTVEAAKAAEWIADLKKNRKKQTMSLRFLDNWFKKVGTEQQPARASPPQKPLPADDGMIYSLEHGRRVPKSLLKGRSA